MKYHVCKSLSAELAHKAARYVGSISRLYVRELVAREVDYLFLRKAEGEWPNRQQEMDYGLDQISRFATELDFDMLRCRSAVRLAWHDPKMAEPKQCFGFPFKKQCDDNTELYERIVAIEWAWWNEESETEGLPVDLVAAPGLVRSGSDLFTFAIIDWEIIRWLKPLLVVVEGPQDKAANGAIEDESVAEKWKSKVYLEGGEMSGFIQ